MRSPTFPGLRRLYDWLGQTVHIVESPVYALKLGLHEVKPSVNMSEVAHANYVALPAWRQVSYHRVGHFVS